jgi:hypothetical protein
LPFAGRSNSKFDVKTNSFSSLYFFVGKGLTRPASLFLNASTLALLSSKWGYRTHTGVNMVREASEDGTGSNTFFLASNITLHFSPAMWD